MSLFSECIFNDDNPYGYRININHPKVRKLYERYKKWKGIPPATPMSDNERLEFEMYLIKKETHNEQQKTA